METEIKRENPLGTQPVGAMLRKFTIPSIIAMLVGALYNIVDQYFIGNNVGELGNAATNIAFPLSISCVAIALLCGIGGASAFNLAMGRGEKDEAGNYIGNAIMIMVGIGLVLGSVTLIFLEPILKLFGSPADVLPYAKSYTRITAIGFPFMILGTGGGHLIRADGSPQMTMICNLSGAIVNVIFDYLFVNVLGYGMEGAAIATVMGQMLSAGIAIWYFTRYKTVKLVKKYFRLRASFAARVCSLGAAPCSNQLAMMIVQIVMNNSLKYYGAMSDYGEAIPIACAGIVSKVCMVFFSFVIGISQGLQPIVSFNYGAQKYDRVKKAYRLAVVVSAILSVLAFAAFQIFPRNIILIFGKGSEEYIKFSVSYFRIYMFFIFINFLQPISSNFFTAIGKPARGMFLSLTRQIIFLLPLILILPLFLGIDGVLYSGPIADALAATVTIAMMTKELKSPCYQGVVSE